MIELKNKSADPIGQLEGYLVEVESELADKHDPPVGVQGILITETPNWALERELPKLIPSYPVKWFVFRAKVELVERIRVP